MNTFSVQVKLENEDIQPLKGAIFVNAAGPWAGEVARMAGIGTGPGALSVPLPVEPRQVNPIS